MHYVLVCFAFCMFCDEFVSNFELLGYYLTHQERTKQTACVVFPSQNYQHFSVDCVTLNGFESECMSADALDSSAAHVETKCIRVRIQCMTALSLSGTHTQTNTDVCVRICPMTCQTNVCVRPTILSMSNKRANSNSTYTYCGFTPLRFARIPCESRRGLRCYQIQILISS